MKFESPNALTGVFLGGFIGKVEFKGYREGFEAEMGGGRRQTQRGTVYWSDPSYEWHKRNEDAYERARRGRWR